MSGENRVMKVYLPSLNKKATTGKGFFYYRLAQELISEVDVGGNEDDKYDIAVNNVRVGNIKAKHQIVRIDGVYHDTGRNYKKLNKQIFRGFLKLPDGVIYQSQFSKNMGDKYLGKTNKPCAVIHNGADPRAYEYVEPIEKKYEFNFFSFSRWRPHKRLKDIVGSFRSADIDDSCLYIAGDLSKAGVDKKWLRKNMVGNVKYVGVLSQPEIASYLKIMDGTIHMCWFDSCPNSVVESIIAGVPVVSNNIGGTAELVSASNGYVCEIDKLTLEPVNLYHPPKIDRSKIADALRKCTVEDRVINKDHVDIRNVAKQYYDFFKEVAGE